MDVRMEPRWKEHLHGEFDKDYFAKLRAFVRSEYRSKKVYPEPANIFRALDHCPFDKVKVIILGQDPYHGAGQANGLCFAVNEGVTLPPSLRNIFSEIESDLGMRPTPSGDLTRWANQGVLLLNATLTVAASQPGSHQKKGWEEFTDSIIERLSAEREHLVFILWGRYAQAKGAIIDRQRHLVLESAHPSPFSAHSGFFGCKHFSKANTYLDKYGQNIIDWC
ncbi:uracil-DNA glycosylase [Candidatus Peregrinibacteria bacterium CG_4_9_14_0_2_um_filter_53_11]|nr:MAG: uracil-DNA glycosylase [Candidatus Peregrinibacteria bacterium CG_4_9_14_0_2_um_filter_53_11]